MATKNRKLPSNERNFGATPPIQLQRSQFNLSKSWKGTFDAGFLIPFFVSEVIPGDSRKVRVSHIIRLATPLKPFMDNLKVTFHFWWVPTRQIWTNFIRMMGEQDKPGDSIDFLAPRVFSGALSSGIGKLGDMMGLPPTDSTHVSQSYRVSALPFRAYARIWNFHYRDQNLQDPIYQPDGDADDDQNYGLQRRGKRHDYLTAALPTPQKGSPVALPLGGRANIYTDANNGQNLGIFESGTNTLRSLATGTTAADKLAKTSATDANDSFMYANLAESTTVTITQLRQSIAIQHVLERDARSGTRYPEILLARYRVMDPQMLVLQRPEFLGGGSSPITVNPVPSTAPSPDSDPKASNVQGNLAAVGVGMGNNIGFTRSFTEFGYVLGLMCVTADLTYQQGIERMWSRRSRFDFYHPELAHLSEEAILQKEIYVTGNTNSDDAVWGYIGAYDSYRYGQSLITGRFRSQVPNTLDTWHLSQNFANSPTLNSTFIQENPPVDRVIAVTDEPQFIADLYIQDNAVRAMPISGIPGLSRI